MTALHLPAFLTAILALGLLKGALPLLLCALLLWPRPGLLKTALVARNILGLRLSPSRCDGLPLADLPPHMAELLRPGFETLAGLGLPPRQAIRIVEANHTKFVRFIAECATEDGTIRALLRKDPSPTVRSGSRIALRSTLGNGDELITSDHEPEAILPVSSALKSEWIPNAEPADLLARHRERLAEAQARGIPAIQLNREASVQRYRRFVEESFDAFRQSGRAAVEADGTLRWKPLPALAKARELLRFHADRSKKAAAHRKVAPPRIRPPLSEETQATLDWEYYEAYAALQRGRMPWMAKAGLMLGSLLGFILALGVQLSPSLGSPSLVSGSLLLIVLGVLVFHECGHLLGMRLFGYRDTQLLFLPFLGGAAVGLDNRVLKPWQNLAMLFMGPLPGLFIGIALCATQANAPGWLRELAWILVFLNAFNLLPFLPLEGGQIVDTVFTSRLPRAKVVFTALSAAGLVLIGMAGPGGILLMLLGIFMLLRLPQEWRLAGTMRDLRRSIPAQADEPTAVRAILRAFRGPKWTGTTGARRFTLAYALQGTLRRPMAGWGTLLLAALGYASPVVLAVVLLGAGPLQGGGSRSQEEIQALAAGLPQELPAYVPKGLPDAQNAALPLKAATDRLLVNDGDGRRRVRIPLMDGTDAAGIAAVETLLGEAAGRPAFDPGAAWFADASGARDCREALAYLVARARSLAGLHRADRALALGLDGLRLERDLEAYPGYWSYDAHLSSTLALWSVIDDALADGSPVPPSVILQIRAQIDPAGEFAFARQAILLQSVWWRKFGTQDAWPVLHRDPTPLQRAELALARLLGSGRQEQIASIKRDLRKKALLDGIAAGHWPSTWPGAGSAQSINALVSDPEEFLQAYPVYAFIDETAFLRMADAGLAIAWQRAATGHAPTSFGAIRVAGFAGIPTHPITHRPLQWRGLGGRGFLSFPTDQADDEGQTWRLAP